MPRDRSSDGGASLRLCSLTRRYGETVALDGLSLDVRAGEVTGLVGPNGAGKTTAMRAIFGLVALDGGAVEWHGRPVGEADRRRFGYMPEERGLYPGMTVLDQIVYLGRLHGLAPATARAAAASWLERLGVAERASSKVETLSLGNQQRVQLAAALVHDPELLVLDEPLSGLDPDGIDQVGELLVEQARAGRTVIFSSHQLELVEHLCDSVAIVRSGRLVAGGRVDDLLATGPERLVVQVEGDLDGSWARTLPDVTVLEAGGGRLRLQLSRGADAQRVLVAAMKAGPVREFGAERRRLSEVFRESLR